MLMIILGIMLFILLICFLITWYSYKKTFYSNRKKERVIIDMGLEFHRPVLKEYYEANGGDIKVIVRSMQKHHPHGLDNPMPIIEFVEKYV